MFHENLTYRAIFGIQLQVYADSMGCRTLHALLHMEVWRMQFWKGGPRVVAYGCM